MNMNATETNIILCPTMKMSHTTDPAHFDYSTGVITSIVNGILILPTTTLNLLLILSILTRPSLRRPSYILICALAFSDFGVGVLVQPLYIARKIKLMTGDYESYCLLFKMGNIAAHIICSPSFLIVTGIALDRYLAISLKTSYSITVTNNRVLKYLASVMVIAVVITMVRLHAATSPKYMTIPAIYMCIILIIILYCYFRSLKHLQAVQQINLNHNQDFREHGNEIVEHNNSEEVRISASSHRRVLATLMIIVITLFCCYIPFVAVVIAMAAFGRSKGFMMAWEWGLSLLFLNSFINPLLHFARLKELREACIALIRKTR